mgnify:CR=1 FL=1
MIAFWLLTGLLAKKAEPDEPQFVLGGSRRRKAIRQTLPVETALDVQRQNEALILLLI